MRNAKEIGTSGGHLSVKFVSLHSRLCPKGDFTDTDWTIGHELFQKNMDQTNYNWPMDSTGLKQRARHAGRYIHDLHNYPVLSRQGFHGYGSDGKNPTLSRLKLDKLLVMIVATPYSKHTSHKNPLFSLACQEGGLWLYILVIQK